MEKNRAGKEDRECWVEQRGHMEKGTFKERLAGHEHVSQAGISGEKQVSRGGGKDKGLRAGLGLLEEGTEKMGESSRQ